jgi:hypothetical protein
MQQNVPTTVTFAIRNRMYGVNVLAKHLNSLVKSGKIQGWHPGRWIDWHHREIEIGFDSAADARFAETTRGEW